MGVFGWKPLDHTGRLAGDFLSKNACKPAACWTSPDASGENKWCPEEDSNLHALASAST